MPLIKIVKELDFFHSARLFLYESLGVLLLLAHRKHTS